MSGGLLLRLLLRSGAPYLIVLGLALEVPTYLEGRAFVGETASTTYEVANGSASLLAILGAVAAAAVGVMDRDRQDILSALPRRGAVLMVIPGLSAGLVLCCVHLAWICFVAATHQAVPRHGELVGAIAACLCIMAGSCFGGLLAAIFRNWIVPPLLGIAMYAVLMAGYDAEWAALVRIGGAGLPLSGLEIRPMLSWAQVAWFGSAVAVVVGLTIVAFRASVAGWLVSGMTALLLLASFGGGAVAVGEPRYQVSDEPWVCAGQTPQFCALRAERDQLHRHLAVLERVARKWAVTAPQHAPDVYWRRVSMPVPDHEAEFSWRSHYTPLEAAEVLIEASFPCSANWSYQQYETMLVLARQVAHAAPIPSRKVARILDGLAC